MGTFDGSRDLSNPYIFVFQYDETSSKWPGGSETSITSSSFTFERPHNRFEVNQIYHKRGGLKTLDPGMRDE